MTAHSRRQFLAMATATALVVPAGVASAGRDRSEIERCWAERADAIRKAEAASARYGEIRCTLPAELYDDPIYHRPGIPAMRSLNLVRFGDQVSFDTIKKYNWHTEDIVRGSGDPETEAEYQSRRAEGRARIRWWIAEKRKLETMISESGVDQAATEDSAAWDAVGRIAERMIKAPVTSLNDVRLLALLACNNMGVVDETDDDLDWEDKLLLAVRRGVETLADRSATTTL